MSRACIICGVKAGSREHIFPAALGGRRTNKGIYCGLHNGAYSGLAGIIASQLAIFNAQLGVIGDHADAPTSVTMTDVASGRDIDLSSSTTRFKKPQIRSETTNPQTGQSTVEMAFSSQQEADAWIKEQKELGIDVQLVQKQRKSTYYLGTARKQITLGGDKEGLRSIAYIAQTFLAHSFPEIARSPGLDGLKNYTLHNQGTGYAWWDFGPPVDLPPNNFPFGHRVIVGVNGDNGAVYARVSLFSTLNFALLLGNIQGAESAAVITDIDPLAKSPPNDIVVRNEKAALGEVSRPEDLGAELAGAVRSSRAEMQVKELIGRIVEHERDAAAGRILDKITGAAALQDIERDALFANIVHAEAQRAFNLLKWAADDLERRASLPIDLAIANFAKQATALDPNAENGLSAEATHALAIACEALAQQMSEDCKAGSLDRDRISMLIGGGPGCATVAGAVLNEFAKSFPD